MNEESFSRWQEPYGISALMMNEYPESVYLTDPSKWYIWGYRKGLDLDLGGWLPDPPRDFRNEILPEKYKDCETAWNIGYADGRADRDES